MQFSKDNIISAITKIYNNNYDLNKRNIELDAENVMLKDKIKRLIQGNKSKQELINKLEEQVHSLERKINKLNALQLFN